jgi:hypothetical protein
LSQLDEETSLLIFWINSSTAAALIEVTDGLVVPLATESFVLLFSPSNPPSSMWLEEEEDDAPTGDDDSPPIPSICSSNMSYSRLGGLKSMVEDVVFS